MGGLENASRAKAIGSLCPHGLHDACVKFDILVQNWALGAKEKCSTKVVLHGRVAKTLYEVQARRSDFCHDNILCIY